MIRRAERGRTYLIGSPTSVLMRDITFPTFREIAMLLGAWDQAQVRLSPYPNVTLGTGALVRFRTAEDPEMLRGPNLSGVWLDEASLMKLEAYNISIASLREASALGWLTATFTPKGYLHWTHNVFGSGRPNTKIFQSHTKENPFNHPDFERTIAEQYGEGTALYDQELGGLFTNLEGAEWPGSYFDGPGFWFEDWPDLQHLSPRIVALDPSKGTDVKKGDFQALVKYARDPAGVEYVEADLGHRPMTSHLSPEGNELGEGMMERAIDWSREFGAQGLGIETNQFAVLLKIPFEIICKRRGYEVPLYCINNMENKAMRIRRLGPPLAAHKMRFRNTRGTRLLVEQLKRFRGKCDEGEHDDGPDALEMARRLAIEMHNKPKLRRDYKAG